MPVNLKSAFRLSAIAAAAAAFYAPAAVAQAIFINEIHYDNTGGDLGEAVEIAGPAGTDVSNIVIQPYNGSNGQTYTPTGTFTGTIPDQQNGFGTRSVNITGLQNGAPDGLALVQGGAVIQFLCYEGTFTATNGPASGMTCTDIGVSENGAGAVGNSLRLAGTGMTYPDFTWQAEAPNTFGAVNTGQTFATAGSSPVISVNDVTIDEGNSGTTTFAFTVSLSAPAGAGGVTFDIRTADGTATNTGSDYIAQTQVVQTIPEGMSTYTFNVPVIGDAVTEPDETFFVNLSNITGADMGDVQGLGTITNDDVVITRIRTIQGMAHVSPLTGSRTTIGIVTARASNGFYIQDPEADGDENTSEGIFVFTSSAPAGDITVGSEVRVTGTVEEFRPNGTTSCMSCLTVTRLSSPTTTVGDFFTGTPSITPTVIGAGGRVPPNVVIDNDTVGGDIEIGAQTFDPAQDGIDFYETLEGMVVQVNNPVTVAPTTSFGELWVLADNGTGGSERNLRGGVTVRAPNDFNPDRLQIDDQPGSSVTIPTVNTGATLGTVTGVLSYSFGDYEVLTSTAPTMTSSNLAPQTTTLRGQSGGLTIATYNVLNLSFVNNQAKFDALANQIVTNLQAPDIIALQEVQDDNGSTDDGTVTATQTLNRLVTAIQNVVGGGPTYTAVQIDPVNNTDGGAPGSNIRVAYLFKADRVSLVTGTIGAGDSTTETGVTSDASGLRLTRSPGRIGTAEPAFAETRKSLAAHFRFRGQNLFLINNHLSSKTGSDELFGRNQPPLNAGETERTQQAAAINAFVDSLRSSDVNAQVVVLGDFNEFSFLPPMQTLRGVTPDNNVVLTDLGDAQLGELENYTFKFDGNAQGLDHLLATPNLTSRAATEVVHANIEFTPQTSDHDPVISRFSYNVTPDQFTFTDVTDVAASSVQTSDAITVLGIEADADISVTGGSYSIGCDGTFVTAPGLISNGQTVCVRHTASSEASTATNTVLTIGGVSDIFTSTTAAAGDTTPLAFSFDAVNNAEPNTLVVSNSIMVLGTDAPAPISITGGEFSINNGSFTSMVGAVVNPNDLVRVRLTSSGQFETSTTATLDIGGVTADFVVTTRAVDVTPNAFNFKDRSNVRRSSTFTSELINLTGFEAPVPVSITAGGQYSTFNSTTGRYNPFTSEPGMVSPGGFQIRQMTSGNAQTASTVTVTVGGVSDTWTVTTGNADNTPAGFNFPDRTNAFRNTLITSNLVTIEGFDEATPISVTGGEYRFFTDATGAFSPWTTAAANLPPFTRVQLRRISAETSQTTNSVTVTIGGVSDTWNITTGQGDGTPNAFNFADVSGVTLNTLTQSPTTVTPAGFDEPLPISITNGAVYRVRTNGTFGPYTSANGMLPVGSSIQVAQTSANDFETTTTTTITIGGVSDVFNVTTGALDTTPNQFTFPDTVNAPLNTETFSNVIPVSGYTAPIAISVVGGEYRTLTNGVYTEFTAANGTLEPGTRVQLRVTSSLTPNTTQNIVFTAGGVSDTWSVTTGTTP